MDVDVSEVMALADELAEAGPKVERLSSDRLSEVAARLRDDARAAAPVETGELRASIYLRGSRNSRIVGSDVRQGFFQEFGTSVMAPQPWLWPASKVAESALFRELQDIGDPFV